MEGWTGLRMCLRLPVGGGAMHFVGAVEGCLLIFCLDSTRHGCGAMGWLADAGARAPKARLV